MDADLASGEGPAPIEFTGRASEYFGIWLANAALSVVTLGIYSAWAKVRSRRYFLGNTVALGDRMDYHATGAAILKGRLLAAAAVAAYVALSYAGPWWAQAVGTVGLLPLYPWIINRSMKFNARMTSWRNVRFDWHGGYWGVAKIYFFWPLIAVLTLGVLAPVAARRVREYLGNHYAFGRERFAAVTALRPYYSAYLKAWALGTAAALAIFLTTIVALQSVALRASGAESWPFPGAEVIGYLLAALVWFVPTTYFWIAARNILVNALTLGEAARFHSAVVPLRYVWILVTNFLAVVFTATLLYPWARVRRYRYQAECTAITLLAPDAAFLDVRTRAGGALGEELGAAADIEIGL